MAACTKLRKPLHQVAVCRAIYTTSAAHNLLRRAFLPQFVAEPALLQRGGPCVCSLRRAGPGRGMTCRCGAADMHSGCSRHEPPARDGCLPLFAACCRDRTSCNVFVWCPLTSGCAGAGNTTAPFLSCQLKRQDGMSGQPGAQPQAFQRGPPASFVSGAMYTHPAITLSIQTKQEARTRGGLARTVPGRGMP